MRLTTRPAPAEPTARRWTRQEYRAAASLGWFAGQRLQLVAGEIVEMPPMGYPHAWAVDRAARLLRPIFEPACWVRGQMPLAVSVDSEPEPDVSVVKGGPDDYTDHPTTALLVIEVSDSTLRFDRRLAAVYAAAGVPEYWIVNLPERRIEVHREPVTDPASGASSYAAISTASPGQVLAPLSRPDAALAVADFFPA